MSDGETASAVLRYFYRRDAVGNVDLGTAKQWNITVVGVTRPLEIVETLFPYTYTIGGSAFNASPAFDYSIGLVSDSTSAPVSVSIYSVGISSGSQFIDGASVDDAQLRGMLTAAVIIRAGNEYRTQLTFAPTNNAFQYLPLNSTVVLSYVVRHSRGTSHRFRTVSITVRKGSADLVTAIPESGLSPIVLSQPAYADTPFFPRELEYSDSDPDAVTVFSSAGQSFQQLKTIEIIPSGEQLKLTDQSQISFSVSGSSHILASFSSQALTRTFTEFGYIMRPYDPLGGYGFDSDNHPAQNLWSYNVAEVETFLSGGYTMPYYSGNSLATNDAFVSSQPGQLARLTRATENQHSTEWTMEVTEPTQFCAKPLCSGQYIQSEALERFVTCKVGGAPATLTRGSDTFANPCHGQEDVEFVMPLSTQRCMYSGSRVTCQTPGAIGRNAFNPAFSTLEYIAGFFASFFLDNSFGLAPIRISRAVTMRSFYCGDLLWSIENGPCRQTLSTTSTETNEPDVFTLGGDSSLPIITTSSCSPTGLSGDDTCYQQEITVTISGITNALINVGGEVVDEGYKGDGTFVLSGVSYGCNSVVYSLQSFNESVNVVAARLNWCDSSMQEIRVERLFNVTPISQLQGRSFLMMYAINPPENESYPLFSTRGQLGSFRRAEFVGDDAPPATGSYSIEGLGDAGGAHLNAPTILPAESTVSADGGGVSLTSCCPTQARGFEVAATNDRYPRIYSFSLTGDFDLGAIAYITQEGRGDNYCPFTIEWLSGSQGYTSGSFVDARIFLKERCPIKGQVNHAEQPPCEWSVTSSAAWLIAEKIPEEPELEEGEEDPEPAGDQSGLLKLSINFDEPAVFSGSLPGYFRPFRSGTITITSGGTVNTWTIIQLQP
jgi:hypothetical protein